MEHSLSHGSTFQPNDLAMVAGLATLHELDAESLVERSARMGELLLERTRPLAERYDVVKDVRGLGLMWAIELGEPESSGRRTYRLLERMQPALFSQVVVVPLFTEHHVLSQVAGTASTSSRGCRRSSSREDVDWFVDALDATLAEAQKLQGDRPLAMRAARASVQTSALAAPRRNQRSAAIAPQVPRRRRRLRPASSRDVLVVSRTFRVARQDYVNGKHSRSPHKGGKAVAEKTSQRRRPSAGDGVDDGR